MAHGATTAIEHTREEEKVKHSFIPVLALFATVTLMASGCTQSVPAPAPTAAPAKPAAAPTTAPAAPTTAPKAAEPTKAAAPAQPTAAPAAKATWPEKGKSITLIIPWPAGGPVDTAGRILAGALEKELGVAFTIVNKGGANSQIGLTDLVRAKPDGYTVVAANLPTAATTYLDPEAKAIYTRKDFIAVAMYCSDAYALGVKSDSPFKTLKDLVDAAKAKPEEYKIGDTGLTSSTHFGTLLLQHAAGVKFSRVHFEGGAPATTAMLGGHVDGSVVNGSALVVHIKAGAARSLGLMDKEQTPLLPGVKTMDEQGYKVYSGSTTGLAVPAGTPMEVVSTLSAATKKVLETNDVKQRFDELTYVRRYMDSKEFGAYWDAQEEESKRLLPLVRN